MMMFVVAMSSVLFTSASEINDYDFDVFSWEDDFDVFSWEDGKEFIIEDTLGLKRTGLRRRLQDESAGSMSDDWPYESDDGPPVDKLIYSVLVFLGICMFVSLVVGVIVCLWHVFIRRSPKDRQHLPEPTYVITPPIQVFTR